MEEEKNNFKITGCTSVFCPYTVVEYFGVTIQVPKDSGFLITDKHGYLFWSPSRSTPESLEIVE